MKVTIKYICPECETPGQVTITEFEDKKDFSCLKCGYENSLEVKSVE